MNKGVTNNAFKWVMIVCFFIMTAFPVINTIFFKIDAAVLVGVENNYTMPRFSWEAFFKGEFQSEFEKAFSKGFSGYRAAVRLKNELRYRLFDESGGDIVVCSDDQIMSKSYIDEYLGLKEDYYCSDEYIDGLVSQLKTISELSESNGKEFLVLITPTKSDFEQDSIPRKFFMETKAYSQEERGVYKLTRALSENNISYVDSSAVLKAEEYPFEIFPRTGAHWARESAYTVLNSMIDLLNEKGANLKKLNITGRDTEKIARTDSMNSDVDMFYLMNILSMYDADFSYPIVTTDANREYSRPKMFFQGGSFSFPVIEAILRYDIASDVNFVFYNTSFYDRDFNNTPIKSFSEPFIVNEIKSSDLIVLEVNEQYVFNMGAGFYPELINILSECSENAAEDTIVTFENVGPEEEYLGIKYRWVYGSSGIIRVNQSEEKKPLELSVFVPLDAFSMQNHDVGPSVNIDIFLNGKLYITEVINEDGAFNIQIPAESLQPDGENVIEIVSPYLLYDGSGNSMSVQILYVGEVR